MPRTQLLTNHPLDLPIRIAGNKPRPLLHDDKEADGFVLVNVWSPAAYAYGVGDGGGKVFGEDVVDFSGAEAHAGGFEDAVGAAEHEEAVALGEGDEIAVGPDAGEAFEAVGGWNQHVYREEVKQFGKHVGENTYYAARYFSSPPSPKKVKGWQGNGLAHTNSPGSPLSTSCGLSGSLALSMTLIAIPSPAH